MLCCRNSASSRGPRLLEEILRWGTTQLFDSSAAAARDTLHAQEALKRGTDGQAEAMDMDEADKELPGVLPLITLTLTLLCFAGCGQASRHFCEFSAKLLGDIPCCLWSS